MQAMIFAAGLGTRLKPITDTMPKALVPVNGKPLLEHVIDRLTQNGFTSIVINVHHFAQQIKDYLNENGNFGLNIAISDESDMLLETGGGIKKASSLFRTAGPVLIHNVDILCNADLRGFYEQAKDNVATFLVSSRESSRGLYFDDDDNLVAWANMNTNEIKSPFANICKMDVASLNADYRRFAFSGIHTFSPKLFKYFAEFPDRFGIIDFYLNVCNRERIKCCVKNDLQLIDVGKLSSLKDAESFVRNEIK